MSQSSAESAKILRLTNQDSIDIHAIFPHHIYVFYLPNFVTAVSMEAARLVVVKYQTKLYLIQ